jgi:hypothetical protein
MMAVARIRQTLVAAITLTRSTHVLYYGGSNRLCAGVRERILAVPCRRRVRIHARGMSYAQVQQAVPHSARVVSDPPRVLTLDLARQQVAALDRLPRPTLISCRSGPRASAVAYMYAGLKLGATVDAVLAAAERDNAPFCTFLDIKDWLRSSMESLQREAGFRSEDQQDA